MPIQDGETTRPAPVVVETSFRYVHREGGAIPVRVTMLYRPADPHAVELVFRTANDDDSASWTFARELLACGLYEPTGIADVRAWPWETARGRFIALALTSPDGNALFEIPRRIVERFLTSTYEQVRRGEESAHQDVDGAIVQLLGR